MAHFPVVVVLLLSVSLLVAAQPAQYCSNIAAGSNKYDLSWWQTKGPFQVKDATGEYTWTFSLCSPLPTPCMDTADGSGSNACGTPGSAAVCETWPNQNNPAVPNSACCANANSVPTFAEYNLHIPDQGADRGLVMTVGGGDECGICAPSTRATSFTIVCDASTTPNIISAENANVPSPVYNIEIRHCSGCPTSDSRSCSGPTSATIDVFASIIDSSPASLTTLTLLPPPNQLTVDSNSPLGLRVTGGINQALNATVDFQISTPNGPTGVASLGFPGPKIAVLSLRDVVSGKSFPCNPSKVPRSPSVAFACTFGANIVFVLQGSIL